mmetsp:Transcript_44159/g.74385  ORF Transcript_44159/g.74385 Transcript_44159/m.74385 type:complete len:83 (+) Transcript_44159:187-435(+)
MAYQCASVTIAVHWSLSKSIFAVLATETNKFFVCVSSMGYEDQRINTPPHAQPQFNVHLVQSFNEICWHINKPFVKKNDQSW